MRIDAKSNLLPLATVTIAIIIIWYVACVPMNEVVAKDKILEAGGVLWSSFWNWLEVPVPLTSLSFGIPYPNFSTLPRIFTRDFLTTANISWNEVRPVLPSPHQVIREIWNTVFAVPPWTIKSLIYHLWITLSSASVGFVMGGFLGILLAIGIVHVASLEKSLMPWVIASQTIPILAIAPMLIVVLGKTGLPDIFTKATISAYLCFFPVTIGMVKGLRSPDVMQQDLMRTYNASAAQTLWKLRLPASLPFLFASLKVSVAIAMTGAIVAELPTGAVAGIGARLLNGSYYGNTLQIWAALFVAAFAAALLVWVLSAMEKQSLKRMGAKP